MTDPIPQLAEAIWHARYGNRNVDNETSVQIWLCAENYIQNEGYFRFLENHGMQAAAQDVSEGLLGITHQDIADKAVEIYEQETGDGDKPEYVNAHDRYEHSLYFWFVAENMLRRGERE